MRHLLQPYRLPAVALPRAGLRAPLLVLLAMFSMLMPGWPSATLSTAAAGLAVHAPVSGEEGPTGESAERESPAKLRRAATLQAPRAAWSRPAPPRPSAPAGDQAVALRSTVPVAAPAPPDATPVRWRLQRSQAPPLA